MATTSAYDLTAELQRAVRDIVQTPPEEFELQRVLARLLDLATSATNTRAAFLKRRHSARMPAEVIAASDEGVLAIEGSVTTHAIPIISEGEQLGVLMLIRDPGRGMTMEAKRNAEFIADLAATALRRASDTEALRRNEQALQNALQTKYRLIGGVAVNLKETLSTAAGYLQLLELQDELNDAQQEYTSRGRRAISTAVSLINELVELARADAGDLPIELGPVNVAACVRDAGRNHTLIAQGKHILITTELAVGNAQVHTDHNYLRQILDALLSNAVRYTPDGGCITLRVDQRDGRRTTDPERWITITVTDSGPGISDPADLFEEIKRVEQYKLRLGFRLVICRRIARMLGGDLTLDNRSGRGASFTLWIPRA